MPDLFLLISHDLTADQMSEAKKELGCDRFITLPAGLQKQWSSVDPCLEKVDALAVIFKQWLESSSRSGDYCHIQGDFGITCALVSWAWRSGRIPVYATTERIYEKEPLVNGMVRNTHLFRHVRYRRYPEI
jgi:hypothetical protein